MCHGQVAIWLYSSLQREGDQQRARKRHHGRQSGFITSTMPVVHKRERMSRRARAYAQTCITRGPGSRGGAARGQQQPPWWWCAPRLGGGGAGSWVGGAGKRRPARAQSLRREDTVTDGAPYNCTTSTGPPARYQVGHQDLHLQPPGTSRWTAASSSRVKAIPAGIRRRGCGTCPRWLCGQHACTEAACN